MRWNRSWLAALSVAFVCMSRPALSATGTLTGLVKDNVTGAVLDGASVFVTQQPSITAVTNAQGWYALTGVTAGTVTVSASAALHQSGVSASVAAKGGKTVSVPDIRLAPWGSISGVVVSASNGTPIAGASITGGGGSAGTTNASGAFSVQRPAGSITLTITATGWVTRTAGPYTVVSAQTTNAGNIPMSPWGVITGTVVNATFGGVVPGATVTVTGTSNSTTTNSSGVFSLSQAPGSCTLTVTNTGWNNATTGSLTVVSGQTTNAGNIALVPKNGSVSGTVLNIANGSPVSGATVRLNAQSPLVVTTNASGGFTITGVPMGMAYTVTVTATGFLTFHSGGFNVNPGGNTSLSASYLTAGTESLSSFSVTPAGRDANVGAGATMTYTSRTPFQLTETLVLKNQAGVVVRTLLNAASRPAGVYTDVWNGADDAGNAAPDGPYFWVATATSGANSVTVDLTGQPIGTDQQEYAATQAAPDFFNNRPLRITYTNPRTSAINVAISPVFWTDMSDPRLVYLKRGEYEEFGAHKATWPGVDAGGLPRPDLHYTVISFDETKFWANAVVLYGRKPGIQNLVVTPALFEPLAGTQNLQFDLTTFQGRTADVTVSIRNTSSLAVLRTLTRTAVPPGPVSIVWDGLSDGGLPLTGDVYALTLTASDPRGGTAKDMILTTVVYR